MEEEDARVRERWRRSVMRLSRYLGTNGYDSKYIVNNIICTAPTVSYCSMKEIVIGRYYDQLLIRCVIT